MLTAEQINSNWEEFRHRINTYFPTRNTQLNKLYDELEDRIAIMPASSVSYYHNAFAGGYVDHILRVMDCTDNLYELWKKMGADVSGYTQEELRFAAMHHDLGKIGFPGDGNEVYQVETSEWHRKNQGKMYKANDSIPFTVVPDLSIYLLHHYNISMSWNEYQAIKIHDGMYDDANKPYFVSRSAQAKLKTNLPLILHHGDHMAAQIEYERWRNLQTNSAQPVSEKSKVTKTNAIKNIAENNIGIEKNISDIFSSFNID